MLIPLSYRSYVQLFDYFQPRDDHFHPLPCPCPRPHGLAWSVETGGITPLPDPQEVSSLTPAWDPSSRTPGWTPRQLSNPLLWNSHLTTILHFVLVCYWLALWMIL